MQTTDGRNPISIGPVLQAFLLCTVLYLTVGACGYAAFRARCAEISDKLLNLTWRVLAETS